MNQSDLAVIFNVALWLLGVTVYLWIMWAIIRGAVLSALRKHRSEGMSNLLQ